MADSENTKEETENSNESDQQVEQSVKQDEKISIFAKIKNVLRKISEILISRKVWVPLLLGSLILFFSFGAYKFYMEQKAQTIEYTLKNFNNAYRENNPDLLIDIFDSTQFMYRAYEEIEVFSKFNMDFRTYIGGLPKQDDFNHVLSQIILNSVLNVQADYEFNKIIDVIPPDLNEQIRINYFKVNMELSDPEENLYVFECDLQTVKWGNYPLQLAVSLIGQRWMITKIYNLKDILKIYNAELGNIRRKKELYLNEQQSKIQDVIKEYISYPSCQANITKSSGRDLLTIRFEGGSNNSNLGVVAFGAEIFVTIDKNVVVYQDYHQVNRLYLPGSNVQQTWNIPLPKSQADWLVREELFCNPVVTYVNLSNGKYHEIEL